ncbi:MAG: UbiX family flavin prenyltransferase [Planctomycetota bacterium]
MARVLVAVTGASGAVYGLELIRRLQSQQVPTWLIVSEAARRVLAVEEGLTAAPVAWFPDSSVRCFENTDLAALPASGSSAPDAMIIAPCSMGTAGRILAGVSSSLIERTADVMLKERRPLVLVPRETPLSTLHLRNLLALSELGARIVPAMPAFYFQPKTCLELVEFVVDRALQAAGLPLPLRHPWRGVDGRDAP